MPADSECGPDEAEAEAVEDRPNIGIALMRFADDVGGVEELPAPPRTDIAIATSFT